jgi:hypothetical protein
MKKYLLIALMAGALFSCKKDDNNSPSNNNNNNNTNTPIVVEKVNTPLLIDFTEVWCNPCGTWGTPNFDNIINANTGKVIPMAIHAFSQGSETDELNTPTATDFVNPNANPLCYFSESQGRMSFPTWFVGQTNAIVSTPDGTGIYVQLSVDKANRSIDSLRNLPVVANSLVTQKIDGSTLTATATTQFFSDVTGDYTISFYVVEDNVTHRQAANGVWNMNYTHNHLFRNAISGTWGDVIASGSTAKDKQFTTTKTYTLTNENANNVHVVAAIWKKDGNKYTFVNAAVAK